MQLIPEVGGFTFDLISGLYLAAGTFGLVLLVLLGRYAVAYRNNRGDAGEALTDTGRWIFAVVGGAFVAGFTGLAQAGDIIAQITAFIASHPFSVSNLGVTAVGWLGYSGAISLGPREFVGIAIAIIGFVFIVQGVQDFAS